MNQLKNLPEIQRDKDHQILVTLTSDHPEIFHAIAKQATYINHLMEEQTNAQFFLEVIDRGLLYIYNDMTIFKLLNQPFTPRQIMKYVKNAQSIEEFKHIFPYYLEKATFPAKGINIYFSTQSKYKNEITRLGKEHFQSLLRNHAEIKITTTEDLVIHFLTFEGFSLYMALVASLLTGIFKKIPHTKREKDITQPPFV